MLYPHFKMVKPSNTAMDGKTGNCRHFQASTWIMKISLKPWIFHQGFCIPSASVPSYIKTGKVTEATEAGPPAVKAGKLAMFR